MLAPLPMRMHVCVRVRRAVAAELLLKFHL